MNSELLVLVTILAGTLLGLVASYFEKRIINKKPKPTTTHQHVSHVPFLLPPSDRKTLLIDLDRTLIFSTTNPFKVPPDTEQLMLTTKNRTFYIVKRPFIRELLFFAEAYCFEVVVFTALSRRYASHIIDWLDPNGEISHRLYRYTCSINEDGHIFNDLDVTGRSVERLLVIDDNSRYWKHQDNMIPVKLFKGDQNDTKLDELLKFFEYEQVCGVEDLRHSIRCYKNLVWWTAE